MSCRYFFPHCDPFLSFNLFFKLHSISHFPHPCSPPIPHAISLLSSPCRSVYSQMRAIHPCPQWHSSAVLAAASASPLRPLCSARSPFIHTVHHLDGGALSCFSAAAFSLSKVLRDTRRMEREKERETEKRERETERVP